MANRNKAIRQFIFNQLNGNITYESSPIPVHDSVLQDDVNNTYVLLTDQRADAILDHCMNRHECEIDIEIYSKQMQTVSKDVIDDVAEQVETLLLNALSLGVEFEGWQFINFYLSSSINNSFELSPTKSQVSQFMTFRLQAARL